MFCRVLWAQPPIVVDWIQDGLLWNNTTRGVRVQGNGSATMYLGGANWQDFPGCGTGVVANSFITSGEPSNNGSPAYCLEVVGISQSFCAYQPGIIVAVDYGDPLPSVWVSGMHYSGWFEPVPMNSGPGTFSTTHISRHALRVSGGNFFLGGQSGFQSNQEVECPDRIWKTPYPVVDLGTSWTACMDHPFTTFEMWDDTLLAIGFPTVTKVDTSNGVQMGTFDLFSGNAVLHGHTAIAGDTLFWASLFGDMQIHLGRYLIGFGPVWEVTLPFSGDPIELHRDDHGRLWTASGNNIIWLDESDGSYQSYSFGQIVSGVDIVGNMVAITGSMDGATSYVLRGQLVP